MGPTMTLLGRRALQPQAKDAGQDPPGKGERSLWDLSVILGHLCLPLSQAALRALGKENGGPSAAVPSPLGALSVPEATEAGFYAYLLGGGLREKFSDLGAPWPDHLSEYVLVKTVMLNPETTLLPAALSLGHWEPWVLLLVQLGSLPGPSWDQRP